VFKWNFPILTKIKNYYLQNGFLKTIVWFFFIVIGIKIFVINGFIFILNNLFNLDIKYGPILYYFLGVQVI